MVEVGALQPENVSLGIRLAIGKGDGAAFETSQHALRNGLRCTHWMLLQQREQVHVSPP